MYIEKFVGVRNVNVSFTSEGKREKSSIINFLTAVKVELSQMERIGFLCNDG